MSQSMTGASASQTATKHAGPVPCLTFKEKGEEAVSFYVSLFKDSKVKTLIRSDGRGPTSSVIEFSTVCPSRLMSQLNQS